MLQKALNCLAVNIVFLTAAALFVLGIIGTPVAQADSSLVTILYKNQMHPGIGELAARAVHRALKGEANLVESVVSERRDQWI
jgi:hypothetical protein